MSNRPSVSVVVPFAGEASQLADLVDRLAELELEPGDEVIVADNRQGTRPARLEPAPNVRVVPARGPRTPGFARNCGGLVAAGEWLVFIDADTRPESRLLELYFRPAPSERTAVLAGGIRDTALRASAVARHAVARAQMDQAITMRGEHPPYAQTANCAVRRSAFEAVGGFDPAARTGEDADLCFRLANAGWALEERPEAIVKHESRETVSAKMVQLALHGSGSAWLNRRYPGTFPGPSLTQLARRLGASARHAVVAVARGDSESAAFALLDLAGACAFELGRLLPNRRRS